jgi:hypothetical protein
VTACIQLFDENERIIGSYWASPCNELSPKSDLAGSGVGKTVEGLRENGLEACMQRMCVVSGFRGEIPTHDMLFKEGET